MKLSIPRVIVLALLLGGPVSCDDEEFPPRACSNGDCVCPAGRSCTIPCSAPPCHITCTADNPECAGVCGNGTCTCGPGSACAFECHSGPCHVACEGSNPSCSGVCANGTCSCGAGSTCRFSCLDANCKHECESGASCVVDCPSGNAGQGCGFDRCAAGEPLVCPGGLAVACNASCPEPSGG